MSGLNPGGLGSFGTGDAAVAAGAVALKAPPGEPPMTGKLTLSFAAATFVAALAALFLLRGLSDRVGALEKEAPAVKKTAERLPAAGAYKPTLQQYRGLVATCHIQGSQAPYMCTCYRTQVPLALCMQVQQPWVRL